MLCCGRRCWKTLGRRLARSGRGDSARSARVCRLLTNQTKRREIPHIRRPTLSQERRRKKKSGCCVRNDGWGVGAKWAGLKPRRYNREKRGKGLVHTVLGVPGALLLAHVNHLADVVSIVGADVREHLGGLFQLGFVGGFHPFLEFAHDFVKLLYGFIPSFGIKFVEGLVIIAAKFFDFFSLEVREIAPI